jgi:hypothetical protein
LAVVVHAPTTSSASDSSFVDALDYVDCARTSIALGAPTQVLNGDGNTDDDS